MKQHASILVVDDNPEVLVALKILLSRHFSLVVTLDDPNQLLNLIQKQEFDVVVLDMNFRAEVTSGNEGLFWMRKIRKADPDILVVFLTAFGDVELAVKAVQEGAADFIQKPWENNKLVATINSVCKLRRSQKEVEKLKSNQESHTSGIAAKKIFVGQSAEMDEVYKTISKVAKTDANILILGENGTGKEVIAREIHKQSLRSSEIFVSVDLGAVTESLFESELFGHSKGAFTDAHETRIGRFEVSSGGTLFLDEIGNLSLPMQAKMLTSLQNREINRVGDTRPIPVDLRVITATNQPLYKMVEENNFRVDLLYRINTIVIQLPPLRDRIKDIPLMADFFLKKYRAKYAKRLSDISPGAINKLMTYSWPGNIREFEHIIERAVILSEGEVLGSDNFILGDHMSSTPVPGTRYNLDENEKVIISKALEAHRFNISLAAKVLGITRTTLYRKMEKYDIQETL